MAAFRRPGRDDHHCPFPSSDHQFALVCLTPLDGLGALVSCCAVDNSAALKLAPPTERLCAGRR
jgi:hypothetical protein